MKVTIAEVIMEAPEKYAEILADLMDLNDYDRLDFIWRVRRANSIQKMLSVIGAITLLLSPVVVIKAIIK
jgi:hypothetical protein